MITRGNLTTFPQEAYDGALPPPLCFTAPAAAAPSAPLRRGGSVAVRLATPRLMMDPSNPATWQREYRFT